MKIEEDPLIRFYEVNFPEITLRVEMLVVTYDIRHHYDVESHVKEKEDHQRSMDMPMVVSVEYPYDGKGNNCYIDHAEHYLILAFANDSFHFHVYNPCVCLANSIHYPSCKEDKDPSTDISGDNCTNHWEAFTSLGAIAIKFLMSFLHVACSP
jgi:hypothetical protein